MSVFNRLRQHARLTLRSFRRDEDGVAAVEFAIIAPLLILTYLGVLELSQGFQASRKVSLYARAAADFRRIRVIAPDNVNTLHALGYTLADRTTRYREALELIDRARVAEPGNAAIIDSYGWVLFRLGKKREALGHLRHAYALQKDPDIASHLAQVLWVLGEKDEARKYFQEARKLDPDNRSLQRALQETGA